MNGSSSSEIIVKLFDTLKESSNRTTDSLNDLISQQNELIHHVKNLPMDDIKTALRDQADQASKNADKVQVDAKTLMEKIKSIDGKLTKVLIVISVAFALIGVTYLIVRSTTDTEKITKDIIDKVDEDQDEKHQELIDKIKEEMEKFHKP